MKKGDDEIDPMPKARPGEDFKPPADEKIGLIKLWIDQGARVAVISIVAVFCTAGR